MATTPNFNWSTPDNTGLVKNGALDIRTLGNSIDASLVDLKGGTTGQVLAKASNTDMDFTWAADAGAPTSLGYAAGKNKIINGDFGIWQRGTTFSSPSGYTADRWSMAVSVNPTTSSITQQSFTSGTAPVAGYESQYFMRYLITTLGSSVDYYLGQKIEDVRTFAGQTATFSFWAKSDSARTIAVSYNQNFGSGGSGSVSAAIGTTYSLTTSWQRFSATVNIPSVSGKTIGTSSFLQIFFSASSALANGYQLDIWGVQLESGNTATAFQTATGTIQGELAVCQRYYQKSYAQGTAPATNSVAVGMVASKVSSNTVVNQERYATVFLKSTMRTSPTITIRPYTTASNTSRVSDSDGTDLAAGSGTVTALTSDGSFNVYNNSGGSVTTNNLAVIFHYEASAEL